jgi:hypothetical protein
MSKSTKIIIVVFASVLLLAASIALWAYSNRDEIKQYVLTEINKSLKTNIKVESIRIDLFKQFPKVGLNFSGVWVEDAFKSDQPLMVAEHVYLGFNFWNIVNHNYKIQQITIENGQIALSYDKSDQPNFAIFTEGSDTSEMVLNLQKITLNNVEFKYLRKSLKQDIRLTFLNQDARIDISDTKTSLQFIGSATVAKVKIDKTNWIKEKLMEIDASMVYIASSQTFIFDIPKLLIGKLNLNVDGNYIFGKSRDEIDLRINTNKVDIPAILSMLPIKPEIIEEWDGDGFVKISGNIKGRVGAQNTPNIDFAFDVDNGTLVRKKDKFTLSHITTKAKLSITKSQSILELEKLSLSMNNSTMNGSLKIANFNNAYIESKVNIKMDATDFAALAGFANHQEVFGNIDSDIEVKGYLKDLIDENKILQSDIKGSASWNLKNLQPTFSKNKIIETAANITIGNFISIHSLTVKTQTSSIVANGIINNLAGYVLENKKLDVKLNLTTDYLNLNDWNFISEGSDEDEKYKPYEIVLISKVDRFHYNKIEASSVRAIVNISPNSINIQSLEANAFEGKVRGEVTLFNNPNGYTIKNNFVVDNANLKTLFRQCENFYQQEITDKNLSGNVSGNLQMVSNWDTLLRCDYPTINALLELDVTEGNIINYEPLSNLSKFADIEDLKNLKIATLKTTIYIKDNKIQIPETDIVNNALNLSIYGFYRFDGYMDYHVKVKLSELLIKKRKVKVPTEFEEETENKGMYVYLVMQGTSDNLKIYYDKLSAKKKVKQDLQTEKSTIKEAFKKEFIKEKSPVKETDSKDLEFEIE